MKAEPESRFEKGKDIKFSIDDLAAKTEPEPWDGKFSFSRDLARKLTSPQEFEHIQVQYINNEPIDDCRMLNITARNNLRSMKKGDLAFFYHSSCKIPAIVGTMEIVREHTPDCTVYLSIRLFPSTNNSTVSAHDSSAPYYDASSKPDNPKWSVVHVVFRQKLKTPITLKELKAWQQAKGNPLEEMQMLKLARISVSKVREEEWRFLVEEMKERGDIIAE